jgi:hypothetical protein
MGETHTPWAVQVVPVTAAGLTDVFARPSMVGRAVAVVASRATRRAVGRMMFSLPLFVEFYAEDLWIARERSIQRK